MSDTQVSLIGSGNAQIEQESTEETTLSEVSKNVGHTQMMEKSAKFEGTSNTSIVEENASKNIQASVTASQAQSVSVSKTENRQVTQKTTSHSYSMEQEETEEYEFEG